MTTSQAIGIIKAFMKRHVDADPKLHFIINNNDTIVDLLNIATRKIAADTEILHSRKKTTTIADTGGYLLPRDENDVVEVARVHRVFRGAYEINRLFEANMQEANGDVFETKDETTSWV